MPESDIDGLAIPLARTIKRPPVVCPPAERVSDVIERMRRLAVGSIVVVDEERRPLGILTHHDVVNRVVLQGAALEGAVERVMTRDPVTLPVSASAYEAALVMIQRGLRHIILVDGERVQGVVSERDLFGLQSSDVRHLSAAIRDAQDLDQIEQFGRDISQLARNLYTQGIATGALTGFIASLNDLLTQRVVELEFTASGIASMECCWILMGSEGRSEQTLLTDQDNGIIFTPRAGHSVESERAAILPIAARINAALDRAGYRLCPGNIMASNPQWTLSLDEWRSKFSHWIEQGSPEALLHGSIFFDLRPLHGNVALGLELRRWLLELTPRNSRFLHQMAENALINRPPLGLFGRFELGADGRIDVKLNGAMLVSDAARIYTLAHGIDEVNTERRLSAVAPVLDVAQHEVDAWIAAFGFIQGMRLRRQAECLGRGIEADNRVDPAELNDFNRQILVHAFKQARAIQARLALDYQV